MKRDYYQYFCPMCGATYTFVLDGPEDKWNCKSCTYMGKLALLVRKKKK